MISLRKARAGSTNLGYTWPEDGSVVEVENAHAEDLLSIPDNDFTVVDPAAAPGDVPEPDVPLVADGGETVERAIEEPTPAAALSEAPAPRKTTARRAKKTAASQSASDQLPVEES